MVACDLRGRPKVKKKKTWGVSLNWMSDVNGIFYLSYDSISGGVVLAW